MMSVKPLLPLFLIHALHAAPMYQIGSGSSQTVDEWGTAYVVTNSCPNPIMVPTNSSGEWSSFISGHPGCVSIAPTTTTTSTTTTSTTTTAGDPPGHCYCRNDWYDDGTNCNLSQEAYMQCVNGYDSCMQWGPDVPPDYWCNDGNVQDGVDCYWHDP